MVSWGDNKNFMDSVLGSNVLEDAVEWIKNNLSPEEVFNEDELTQWALETGFIKEGGE